MGFAMNIFFLLSQTVEFCKVRLDIHLDSCHLLLLAARKTSKV